eukprot:s10734_g1.t1
MLTRADALHRSETSIEISVEAMEDAAAAAAMATSGKVLNATEKVEQARSMFGVAYEAARADPVDIPVATGETGPDGQLIVTHKCPGLTWNVAGAG